MAAQEDNNNSSSPQPITGNLNTTVQDQNTTESVPPIPPQPQTQQPMDSMPPENLEPATETPSPENTSPSPDTSSNAPGIEPGTSEARQVASVTTNSSRRSKFPILIGILSVFALIGIASAGYAYYRNRQSADQETQSQQATEPTETPVTSEVTIVNGNIVELTSDGQETVLVNKEDFGTTGITGFARISVSPNNDRVCFETIPPAPISAVYVANIDGSNVVEVGQNRTNCHWLSDGGTIVYSGVGSDDSPVNLYKYSINSASETVLTDDTPTGVVRYYQITGVDDDGTTVLCTYRELNIDTGEPGSEQVCAVNSSNGDMQSSGNAPTQAVSTPGHDSTPEAEF